MDEVNVFIKNNIKELSKNILEYHKTTEAPKDCLFIEVAHKIQDALNKSISFSQCLSITEHVIITHALETVSQGE